MQGIATRLAEVQQRIDAACHGERSVGLVSVSKRFDSHVVAAAITAGCTDLGENYAQELQGKAASLAEEGVQPRWHMIGPVQRNKVKRIASVVHLWHSVDRESLLTEISNRAPGSAVLLQVNFTGEDSKSGAEPAQLGALLDAAAGLDLDVQGLMTMGPTDTSIDPRPTFERCRAAVDHHGLRHCSMGMSGDFETAIAEGSTMVRIGSAIFGERPQ